MNDQSQSWLRNPPGDPVLRGVNWGGLKTLYIKEVRRFFKVQMQTVWAPAITTLLYLVIFTVALGRSGRTIMGVHFADFLAPGLIAMAMKISNDLERMGDYATNIAKRCERLAKEPPVKPLYTIPRMAQISQAMVKDVLDAYVERDTDKAIAVWRRDDEVDDLFTSLFRELLTYMMEDARNISQCIDLIFVAKNLERIGDHATNIAEKIHYIIHGQRINRMPSSV